MSEGQEARSWGPNALMRFLASSQLKEQKCRNSSWKIEFIFRSKVSLLFGNALESEVHRDSARGSGARCKGTQGTAGL